MAMTAGRGKKLPRATLESVRAAPRPEALEHAVRLIHRVCCLAGSGTLIEDIRASDTMAAVQRRDTAALYDQLVEALSYQGTSDQVALAYIQQHGSPRWADLADQLAGRASCPRLRSYWDFHGCRYDKTSRTCAEPEHHADCPLPRHRLRNGRLNQMAYSLFLFLRDVAGGDLIGWIDSRLALISQEAWSELAIRQALIEPLRHVFGASDKVLAMTISDLLLAGSVGRPTWLAGRGPAGGHRYAGSQFPAPERHPASVCCRPCLWPSMLPAQRVCRHHWTGRRKARCAAVQPRLSGDFPAIHRARDLAVLRPRWPGNLQRQPYQRPPSMRQRILPKLQYLRQNRTVQWQVINGNSVHCISCGQATKALTSNWLSIIIALFVPQRRESA